VARSASGNARVLKAMRGVLIEVSCDREAGAVSCAATGQG
jgi:hypothetical protein